MMSFDSSFSEERHLKIKNRFKFMSETVVMIFENYKYIDINSVKKAQKIVEIYLTGNPNHKYRASTIGAAAVYLVTHRLDSTGLQRRELTKDRLARNINVPKPTLKTWIKKVEDFLPKDGEGNIVLL